MQRRKKVETYDDDDDWLQDSPAFRRIDQSSSQTLTAPRAAVPLENNNFCSEAPDAALEASPQQWSDYPSLPSPSDEGRISSPVSIPPTLPPIKGMRKTPSAGILTALAVAESMTIHQMGSGASNSSHPSSVRPPFNEVPLLSAERTVASPLTRSFGEPPSFTSFEVSQEGMHVTDFPVCEKPMFTVADADSFDLGDIADGENIEESFGFPEEGTQLEREAEIPPALLSSTTTATHPMIWQQDEDFQDLSRAYTCSGVPVPVGEVAESTVIATNGHSVMEQQQQIAYVKDSDAFTTEDHAIFLNREVSNQPSIGMPYTSFSPHDTSVAWESGPGNVASEEGPVTAVMAEDFAEKCAVDSTAVTEEENKEGIKENEQTDSATTWWGNDGLCYCDSGDGWRYYWDTNSQQWQPHTYIGGPGPPTAGDVAAVGLEASEPCRTGNAEDTILLESHSGPHPEYGFPAPTCELGPEPPISAHSLQKNFSSSGADGGNYAADGWLEGTAGIAPNGTSTFVSSAPSSGFLPQLPSSFQPQPPAPRPGSAAISQSAGWPLQQSNVSATKQEETLGLHSPAPFAKMLFGGRILLVNPSGTISVRTLNEKPMGIFEPVSGQGGGAVASFGTMRSILASFPGPLGASTNRTKLAEFVSKRQEACIGEESDGDVADLVALWGILHVQCSCAHGSSEKGKKPSHLMTTAFHEALRHTYPSSSQPLFGQRHSDDAKIIQKNINDGSGFSKVQSQLVEGNSDDALETAITAQLWPLALLIAKSLGQKKWQATVSSYVQKYIVAGSPLETFCNIVAGSAGIPAATVQPEIAGEIGRNWRQHAIILLNQQTPESTNALERLGNLLESAGKLAAAHCCFALAGMPLQYSDAIGKTHQFVLLGRSRSRCPRTYASILGILRTELFTWSQSLGNPQAVQHYISVLPYKLVHAHLLADNGLFEQSAAYCAAINTTIQSFGVNVPPGLLVGKAICADLLDRIHHHADIYKISLGGSFTSGSLVSSVGKLLDRGISALMGGGDDKRAGSIHSRSSSFAGDAVPGSIHSQHPRSVLHSGSVTPRSDSAAGGAPNVNPTLPQSAGGFAVGNGSDQSGQPKLLSNLMGKVASFKNLVAPLSQKQEDIPHERENTFYYDDELKIWRERGVDPQPAAADVGAPPLAPLWQTTSPTGLVSHTESSSTHVHAGVSRYVNTIDGSTGSAAGTGTGLLPPMAVFNGVTALGPAPQTADHESRYPMHPYTNTLPVGVGTGSGPYGDAPMAVATVGSTARPSQAFGEATGSFFDGMSEIQL